MRIAIVSMTASPLAALDADAPGQAIHVEGLARGLAGRGHEVVVHTRRDSLDLRAQVRVGPGVTVHHVDAGPLRPLDADGAAPFMPRFASELAQRWLIQPPDVAHAHFWDSGITSVQAAAVATVPVALTFHGLAAPEAVGPAVEAEGSSLRSRLERTLARSVGQVIATCAAEARELVRLGASPERLVMVPEGVDTNRFSPLGDRPSAGSRHHRLLTQGDLTPGSGVDDAVRLIAQVPTAELVVAGGPPAALLGTDPDVARLTQLAVDLGVSDRVRFLGRIPRADLPGLIRSTDVVVCLPWFDLPGQGAMEAMACARPVVATAVGGLPDVVDDGVTGLLVQPQSPHAAALAVRRLLAAPGLRDSMGEQAVVRARAMYDWQHVAQAADQVYQAMREPRLAASHHPLARASVPRPDPRSVPRPAAPRASLQARSGPAYS
jgi:glycosyltransferase involved in cell wall biosynthesis